MLIYDADKSIISSGVSIKRKSGRESMWANTTIIRPIKIDREILLAAYLFIFFSFLAPKDWATGIVKPAVSPKAAPIIKLFIEPTLPTAARAFVPTKRPTIIL